MRLRLTRDRVMAINEAWLDAEARGATAWLWPARLGGKPALTIETGGTEPVRSRGKTYPPVEVRSLDLDEEEKDG